MKDGFPRSERVEAPAARFADDHVSHLTENVHLARGRRLWYAEDLIADAHFSLAQQLQGAQADRVSERPKHDVDRPGIYIRISRYIRPWWKRQPVCVPVADGQKPSDRGVLKSTSDSMA